MGDDDLPIYVQSSDGKDISEGRMDGRFKELGPWMLFAGEVATVVEENEDSDDSPASQTWYVLRNPRGELTQRYVSARSYKEVEVSQPDISTPSGESMAPADPPLQARSEQAAGQNAGPDCTLL
eukprot:6840865-Prymnesium_polylepis.1